MAESDTGTNVDAVVVAGAVAPGEEPAVEVLSQEERLKMAAELQGNCTSLSELLQRLVDDEQQLKEMCAEFIIRDIEEENARMALTRRCLEEQQATMKSAAYVRWATERNKGPLAHGAAPRAPSERGDPEYSFHARDADPWYMGFSQLSAGSTLGAVVATVPDRVVFPSSDLVQFLRGWRKANTEIDAQLADLEQARAELAVSHGEPIVAVINGEPALLPVVNLTAESASAFQGWSSSMGMTMTTIEDGYAAWLAWRLHTTATDPDLHSLANCAAAVETLRDDGTDVLGFVPWSAFRRSLRLRVVLRGRTIICVETPTPDCSFHSIAGVRAPEVVAVLQNALNSDEALCPDVAWTSELRSLSCAASRSGPDDATIYIAVLGGGRCEPDTRLQRFAWGDVCGVARRSSDRGVTTDFKPSIRAPTARVAELEAGQDGDEEENNALLRTAEASAQRPWLDAISNGRWPATVPDPAPVRAKASAASDSAKTSRRFAPIAATFLAAVGVATLLTLKRRRQ